MYKIQNNSALIACLAVIVAWWMQRYLMPGERGIIDWTFAVPIIQHQVQSLEILIFVCSLSIIRKTGQKLNMDLWDMSIGPVVAQWQWLLLWLGVIFPFKGLNLMCSLSHNSTYWTFIFKLDILEPLTWKRFYYSRKWKRFYYSRKCKVEVHLVVEITL